MTAYASDADWLEDALGVLAARCAREVAVTRALRAPGRRENFLGLVLADEDAAALCDEMRGRIDAIGADDAALARVEAALAAGQAASPGLAVNRLAAAFGLDPVAVALLVAAAAPAIDDRFGRVFGFLHDDLGRRALTLDLARRLVPDAPDLPDLRAMLDADAPLVHYRLVVPDDGVRAGAGLRVDERIIDWLLGRNRPDAALAGLIEPIDIMPAAAALYGCPHVARGRDGIVALDLSNGADAALWAVAYGGGGVWRLDWVRWRAVEPARLAGLLARAMRDARLAGALPLLTGFDAAGDVAAVVRAAAGPMVLTAKTPFFWRNAGLAATEVAPLAPALAARTALWDAVLAGRAPARDFAAGYDLPADEIAPLVAHAAAQPGPFEPALRHAVKRRAGRAMAEIAERVETPYDFSALVLPAATIEQVRDFAEMRRTMPEVLDTWGLGAAYHRGRGATALFAGPSGTGKTMAASVVANALGLDLYRIDLAGVVSKYIGETEKNLDRVFDAAERSDAVLLFDEADALFGKRSEVSDAHDRYANIEVSYLLQRMEAFDGLAILATNLSQNLDEAFLRRIDHVVEFPAPQAADRLRLWRKLAGTAAPVADDVDFALLADNFDLTGGAIRTCVLAAAHLAAREGTAIGMRHLVRAVAREYVKQRKPLRKAVFGELYAVSGR